MIGGAIAEMGETIASNAFERTRGKQRLLEDAGQVPLASSEDKLRRRGACAPTARRPRGRAKKRCADVRDRTTDLELSQALAYTKHTLYQLSYVGARQ